MPEVSERQISPDDLFMVVASDGIWEFLSNEEVVNIILDNFDIKKPKSANSELVKRARHEGELREGSCDDITSIVIYFNSNEEKS